MKDGADWRLLEQNAVDLFAAPLRGMEPQDAVELLPTPLKGMHPQVVMEKLRARTQGLVGPIGPHCDPGAPFVPRLPAHYVARPDLMNSLGEIILSPSSDSFVCVTGRTAGVGIMDGRHRKTVIATKRLPMVPLYAAALAHCLAHAWAVPRPYGKDSERRPCSWDNRFYCRVCNTARKLARLLKGPNPVDHDDVWKMEHLEAFDIVGTIRSSRYRNRRQVTLRRCLFSSRRAGAPGEVVGPQDSGLAG